MHDSGDGKIFRIDDVFITGILAEHANVSHRYEYMYTARYKKERKRSSVKKKTDRLARYLHY